MAYIRNYQRDKYYKWVGAVVDEFPLDLEGLDGHLNFFVTQLLVQLIYGRQGGKKVSYHKVKCLIHTLHAAANELQRRHLDPLEDDRIKQNGDVVYEESLAKDKKRERRYAGFASERGLKEDEEPSPGKNQGMVSAEGT